MESGYMSIANSQMFWMMCAPTVLIVGVQAWLFSVRAFKAAPLVILPDGKPLSQTQCWDAFRAGAISAIGPAVAVFIVMISLMATIGTPMAWLRLSIIGAAPTELNAVTMGAKAMGTELGAADYNLTAFASSVWCMSLNGCGWLIPCGLFTHKLDGVMRMVTGGSMAMMKEVCGAAVLGTAGYLATSQSIKSSPHFVAVIVAAVSMTLLNKFSPKWMKEYDLGIAMVIAMFAAVMFKSHS